MRRSEVEGSAVIEVAGHAVERVAHCIRISTLVVPELDIAVEAAVGIEAELLVVGYPHIRGIVQRQLEEARRCDLRRWVIFFDTHGYVLQEVGRDAQVLCQRCW